MITFWKALEKSFQSVLEGEKPKSEPFERKSRWKLCAQGMIFARQDVKLHARDFIKQVVCIM